MLENNKAQKKNSINFLKVPQLSVCPKAGCRAPTIRSPIICQGMNSGLITSSDLAIAEMQSSGSTPDVLTQ